MADKEHKGRPAATANGNQARVANREQLKCSADVSPEGGAA